MSRLNLVLRWVMLAALCLLPACAATTAEPRSSPSPGAVGQPPPSRVRLTLWHSWSGAKLDALNNLARSYEQSHPDVRISLEARPASDMLRSYGLSVADGSAPQILLMLGRYVGDLAERQYIAPLDEVFSADDLADLLPQAVDSARFNEQLYAVPISFDTLTLFYDRRQMRAPPETFTQVLALNAAQRSQPLDQRSLSLGYYLSLETTLPYLDAFGGAVFNQQGEPIFAAQGREATLRWLDWLKSLQLSQDTIVSSDFSAVDAAIQQGRVLSAIDWARRRPAYAQVWGADGVGIAALPRLDAESVPKPLVLSEVLCINTVVSVEQRTVAQDFLRYMIAQSSQEVLWERGQMLPVHRQVTVAEDLQPVLASASESQPFTSKLAAPTIWRPLNDMLRGVVTNTVAVNEAIDSAGAALATPTP